MQGRAQERTCCRAYSRSRTSATAGRTSSPQYCSSSSWAGMGCVANTPHAWMPLRPNRSLPSCVGSWSSSCRVNSGAHPSAMAAATFSRRCRCRCRAVRASLVAGAPSGTVAPAPSARANVGTTAAGACCSLPQSVAVAGAAARLAAAAGTAIEAERPSAACTSSTAACWSSAHAALSCCSCSCTAAQVTSSPACRAKRESSCADAGHS